MTTGKKKNQFEIRHNQQLEAFIASQGLGIDIECVL